MNREELIEFERNIFAALPNAWFRARLDNRYQAMAYSYGRMRNAAIRAVAAPGPARRPPFRRH